MIRTKVLLLVVVVIGLVGVFAHSAEAGVRGNSYSGSFTNIDGNTAQSCMRFQEDGTLLFDRDFGDEFGRIGFDGTYSEFDLFIISFWSGTLNDGTDNSASGLAIFGIVTTLQVRFEGLPFARGFYVISNCTPVPPGPAAEAFVAGAAQ